MPDRSDVWSEDWTKVGTWDIWIGDRLVKTLDQLRTYCDRQGLSLDHFLTLPAAAAMPEELKQEATMYRQEQLARRMDEGEVEGDGGTEGKAEGWITGPPEEPDVTDVLEDALDNIEGKLLGAAVVASARARRRRIANPDFRESLHRRDRFGRFTKKPSTGVHIPKNPRYPARPDQGIPAGTMAEQTAARTARPQPSRQQGPTEIVDLTGPYLVAATRINTRQREELAAGRDTSTLHDKIQGAPGKYTAERQRLHAEIVGTFLNRPGSIPLTGQNPMLFMVGGIPGAGKTTAINSPDGQQALGIDLNNFVILNPDDVKEEMIKRGMMPDYPGLTPNESATLVHRESVDIVRLISTRAMSEGRNVLWDSSMRQEGQAERLIRHATRTPGRPPYDVWMMLVDTPIPVAKQRAVSRYLNGGRFMPLDYIDRLADPQWGSQPRRVFEQLKKTPEVKRWFRFVSIEAPEIVESSET